MDKRMNQLKLIDTDANDTTHPTDTSPLTNAATGSSANSTSLNFGNYGYYGYEYDDDEDENCQIVKFTKVVEADAFYSVKCKIFIMKNGEYADFGVGTLYFKPVKDSEKTQLIVRADTNLGNLLVNLILSERFPSQRMGKNNVMMMCVPNMHFKKPTATLFRVKTAEDADELLDMIKTHAK